MKKPSRNVAQSIRDRLLVLSKNQKEDYNLTLLRYVTERFLYRLGTSTFRPRYILKGATLLRVMMKNETYRPTRDIDVLRDQVENIETILEDIVGICECDVQDDGVVFDTDRVSYQEIKEGDIYHGYRLKIPVWIGSATIPLQIDMGFGDSVYPAPVHVVVKPILDHQPPIVLGYPLESVVAEKFEAIVSIGMITSRMKDFYDLYVIAQTHPFKRTVLYESIRRTFARRQTPLPTIQPPLILGEALLQDPIKAAQWKAFLRRIDRDSDELPLGTILETIQRFLTFVWDADPGPSSKCWNPNQGWIDSVPRD